MWQKIYLYFFIIAVLVFSGCETTTTQVYQQRFQQPAASSDPVAAGMEMVQRSPLKDKVLWQYRTALTAMRYGRFTEAKQLLDDALLTLNAMMSPDKNARKARGIFGKEEQKVFIGEPYERAMAYYYRGILYWMDGEPDNARACFRSAQLMDSDTQNKTYANDWVLFDYLDGLATVKLGGDGSDALKRARQSAKNFTPPDYDPQANVLFFVEFGPGPTKYATGQYGEQLRFRTYQSPVKSAAIKIADATIRIYPYDDLNFQATTRGGRVMDYILANKAVFKETTDNVGNVAIIGGAVLASRRETQEAGLATLGVGILSKVISAATTPAADTRDWNNLPQYLGFAAARMQPGRYTINVEFYNQFSTLDGRFNKTISFTVYPPPRDTVVFISDQSITPMNL
ncbi:MAG: hypothetical protein ACP5MG_02990 [Verrucomicrobiia bacterium]|jgi:tetratricopeptide (TPR) repeat protein